ncbi:amidase [Mesorhizobium sp.]|uniref:amidase n=3 Tax=Mesorhizobium sp. TaxID=1871066 RepID=UPI000FE5291A|nr:amidase [Mesorhizobium sp.]RWI22168.1 MAG: amidase [Mesorhizobium sp.]RWK48616.1 MAG: amidase [Mesorhizobium sp.]RWK95076.1 MAG: amidase [Mesorhizobium sp.]TIQ30556.1 MAG: amidase [Mesorhizobium sp.]TJW56692.1 MAG: amidase [Mesorhizobium sp.]
MSDLDLCYLPASEALKRFKAKKLSPVELMEAVISQAEATKDTVNAFTNTHFDEAMALAKKAEAKYAKGKKTGPLEGLPIGIKDESYIKGKPTTGGSLITRDFVADASSAINERIIEAGGIVHARTATPEFSCATYTWSRLWGVTRNPWNPKFTPGGSSGGSGASLASGTSSIATGSDIGGSIRIPASACGVVGYKPPYGRNPDDPPFNLDFYCHTGPLARTVEDAILLQNVMTGPSPLDIASLRPKLTLPTSFKPIKRWKIAFSMDLGGFEVDPEVVKNTKKALDVFRSLGAEVEEVDLGWGPEALEAGLAYLNHLFGAYLSKLLPDHADEMTTYARKFAEEGAVSKATDFVGSLEVAGRMYMTLGPLLEKYNVLICPTTALPSVPADYDQSKDEIRINGKLVNPSLGWVMTTPFNTMSRCPVLSVPSGQAKNGVPTGIQIVGRTYSDEDVFRAGMAYEKAVGGWYGEKARRPKL